jgi:hypothetical protein
MAILAMPEHGQDARGTPAALALRTVESFSKNES